MVAVWEESKPFLPVLSPVLEAGCQRTCELRADMRGARALGGRQRSRSIAKDHPSHQPPLGRKKAIFVSRLLIWHGKPPWFLTRS